MSNIQRIELSEVTLHCPFCGHLVLNNEPDVDFDQYLSPCEHTLFIAHDEGFEYLSDKARAQFDLPGDEMLIQTDLPEGGYDAVTDTLNLPSSIKFCIYQGAPSGMGSYLGFSPG